MEEDDEFGDLYTDVIRPLEAQIQPHRNESSLAAAAVKAAVSQGRSVDLNFDSDDENTSPLNTGTDLCWNLNSSIGDKILPTREGFDLNLDSNAEAAARIDAFVGKGGDSSGFEARVLENGHGLRLRGKASGESSLIDDDINIIVEEMEDRDEELMEKDHSISNKEDKKYANTVQEENTMNVVNAAAVDEMRPEQILPGLSGELENPRAINVEDEWENEESDDDMQIVLNENNHGTVGMERMTGMIDDDDSDGEPLVIVADNGDVGHHHHQAERMVDEQGRGGEEEGCGADAEKDLGDASNASGGGAGAAPAAAQAKIVYRNQLYHNQSSSQFKYVRPGAATLPGAAPGGITGQIRPPISMGPPAGRGRGDWRPAGMNGTVSMQKGYHPSYGILARGVNVAGRGGLDFTLPSYRTIFEVDIDSFEEKLWKLPGVDVSDFFNFCLNEDSWREYCKQLGQLQLERTMQSRIYIHESGRIEQNYDPELPPELAASVGIQDNPAENSNHGKIDADPDLARRASLPVGRSIPVETGSGDRVPSIDMRRPRMHDMDAIIEIVCHSSMDGYDISKQQDNDPARKDHLGGSDETDDLQQDDADHLDRFSPKYNGNKREVDSRRPLPKNTVHNDDILREDVVHLPSEVTSHFRPDRETGIPHEERSTKGRRHIRSSFMSATENKREHTVGDLKEVPYHAWDGEQSPASSSSLSSGSDRERTVVVGDEMDDRSLNMERVEMALDPPNSGNCKDHNSVNSKKKQKLSSHAEKYSQEYENGKDSNTAKSNDSIARSGSSKHLQSYPDDVDDEVLQHRHPLRAGNIRREVGDEPREREKIEKDELHQSRNQLDNGSWRVANHEYDIIGSRKSDRNDHLKSRSERMDDLCSTRRYEELHMRQVHAEKDGMSHSHIGSSARKKRERDDGSDHLKRYHRGRSKDDEVHYARQKEGGSLRRERSEKLREHDEWHKIKQDDHLSRVERVESRPAMRSALAAEGKTWISHSRGKDDYKASSTEYHSKDIGRHVDLLKQRDRVENDFSQHRSHEDVNVRRNQLSKDEKRSRYNKPTSRNECVSYVSDTSRMRENKRKDTTRKIREMDSGDHGSLIPPKRNQDEDDGSVSEAANLNGRTEQNSGRGHTDHHQSSRKQRDDASTDDEQPDSMRGRSKLEHWSSHKEIDFDITPITSSSLKKRDRDTYNSSRGSLATRAPEDPSEKIKENLQPLVDNKDTGPEMNDDDTKAVKDRHLDTVAKLKKRSERFKLPMPSEKDSTAFKKTESKPLPLVQTETRIDSEIKSERPARRRRWTDN